ncbi:abscisic acid receptor PYL5 isoform X2 [Zea mays]|uniref:abscisic acid receptor PYL5 isoform X2 n=1 Tax=Zea mays TaxID=4577 RepID=UPI0009A9A6B6|nr:abscisic acid receptor PYL5 isoform X2 [Zea mays]|eukprot:XP_020394176.1 RNA-binding post-transcriptional regulator csx1 isoform X2 [Zea mays]
MVGLVGGSTARAEHVVANAGGEAEYVRRMHRHAPTEHQCTSTLVKHIKAPVHLVWELVRRFDQPQRYKPFVRNCVVRGDQLEVGSLRDVNVNPGLDMPATVACEIKAQLVRTAEAARQLAPMLEVGRPSYQGRTSSKMMSAISVAHLGCKDMDVVDVGVVGMVDSQSLSSALEKLYFWERKLYAEVKITSVKIIRNKQTGHSEGYGFIEFSSRATAEHTLINFNRQMMSNVEMTFKLNWASASTGDKRGDSGSDHTIFVGDLAHGVTDSMLEDVFRAKYPSVRGANVVVDT